MPGPVATWSRSEQGTGRRDEEEPRFLAYSITKTFIAALFLRLQEEGGLRLDDRLSRWLPEAPSADRITLRSLLDHTGGVPDYGPLRSYHDAVGTSPGAPWSYDDFLGATLAAGLAYEPGEGWAYSNVGYMLLKRVAELVAGEPLAVTLGRWILGPLSLRSTRVVEEPRDLADLAPAESRLLDPNGALRDVRDLYHPGWVAHGVVAATATNVASFLHAVFRGALLTPASLAEMTALVRVPAPASTNRTDERPYEWREPSYGLGLMADPASPWGAIYGHNGGGPGYAASVFHAADLGGVTVCVLGAEAPGFAAEQVVFAVFDALRGTR